MKKFKFLISEPKTKDEVGDMNQAVKNPNDFVRTLMYSIIMFLIFCVVLVTLESTFNFRIFS